MLSSLSNESGSEQQSFTVAVPFNILANLQVKLLAYHVRSYYIALLFRKVYLPGTVVFLNQSNIVLQLFFVERQDMQFIQCDK